jgi:LPS sulfotransferase NodH
MNPMGFPENPPRRTYVVAATPRSGSTLLCETLRASAVAGRPEEPFQRLAATGLPHQPRDYFRDVGDAELLALLPPREIHRAIDADDAAERIDRAIAEGTTANGVFGTKLMWGYFGDFLAGARLALGEPGLDDPTTISRALAGGGDVAYVQVRRADKLGQAISLWRAIQTQRWRDEGEAAGASSAIAAADATARGAAAPGSPAEPVYHRGAIAHLRDLLASGEASWDAWFAQHGITPVRVVVYEDLVPALEPTVRALLGELGIEDEPAAGFATPRMRRQANGTSGAWRERFLAEEGAT